MVISEEEFRKLLEIKADIEKITTLSSDGKNLLTRVPKDIRYFLNLEKGDKLRWLVDENKEIKIEIIR